MGNPKIKHSYRKQNWVANILAMDGRYQLNDGFFVDWTVPPLFAHQRVNADKLGTLVVRPIRPLCLLVM